MPIGGWNSFWDKPNFMKFIDPRRQSELGDKVGFDSNDKWAGYGVPFVPTPEEYQQQNTPVTAPNPITKKYDQSYFKIDGSGQAPTKPDGIDVGETNDSAPAPTAGKNPWGVSFDMPSLMAYMGASRDADISRGMEFGSKYFGPGNADMKEILDTRRKRAMGLNDDEVQAYRERGSQGINQEMATGLRQLRGLQATSGVRGPAAGGQAIPILTRANAARGNLERDITIADMERRSKELGDYEHSLTGERAGLLGTGFGYAGLGAADRSTALEYGLGKDFLAEYRKGVKDVNLDGDKPWGTKEAVDTWKDNWFDPGYSPWQQYTKKNWGFDGTPFKYSDYFKGL